MFANVNIMLVSIISTKRIYLHKLEEDDRVIKKIMKLMYALG